MPFLYKLESKTIFKHIFTFEWGSSYISGLTNMRDGNRSMSECMHTVMHTHSNQYINSGEAGFSTYCVRMQFPTHPVTWRYPSCPSQTPAPLSLTVCWDPLLGDPRYGAGSKYLQNSHSRLSHFPRQDVYGEINMLKWCDSDTASTRRWFL